jgi:hypothetical protein
MLDHTYILHVGWQNAFLEQILIEVYLWICLVAIKPIAAMAFVSILPKEHVAGQRHSWQNNGVVELKEVSASTNPPACDPCAVTRDASIMGCRHRAPGGIIPLRCIDTWQDGYSSPREVLAMREHRLCPAGVVRYGQRRGTFNIEGHQKLPPLGGKIVLSKGENKILDILCCVSAA